MAARLFPRSATLLVLAFLTQSAASGDTFTCGTSDSTLQTQQSPAFVRFYPVRSGFEGEDLVWRDVEFMWDSLYADGASGDVELTLQRLAHSLVDSTRKNPFRANVSDYRLIYDYFRRHGSPYNATDPKDTTSVVLGSLFPFGGDSSTYKPTDRSHADCYIFNKPAREFTFGGIYPSALNTDDEDVTSDRPVNDVKPANTIMVAGPPASRKIDVAGTGWTAPDSGFFVGFNHEFQHSLPPGQVRGFSTEMFSAGAEAIGGFADTTTGSAETPYTWSLLGEEPRSTADPPCLGGPSPTCVRAVSSNYQGRTLFGAYLAYNFRGADTSATLGAMADDLLWKWAKAPESRFINRLRDLLGDADCGTCAGKNYFRPGGTPLDNASRMALLHHNWRVANYVNRSSLEEGQYGYPPQFGFAPATHVKAWQDFDGAGTDDIVAIPPEVTLTSTHRTNEMALRGSRAFRGNTYPLVLQPFGAEYWVVKSDASIWSPGQDLVLRVTPEDLHRFTRTDICGGNSRAFDARLVASVVAYAPPSGSVAGARLWEHPEWAARAFPPQWIDVDSLAGPLEFVVPSFGDSFKAVVVVLSLADGPLQGYSAGRLDFYVEALHYRLDLGLRTSPSQQPNPLTVSALPNESETSPTWSPAGNQVAYQVEVAGVKEIRRRGLTGGSAQAVTTGHSPDWSPRGDLIAFARDSSSTKSDVWLHDTLTSQSQRLTFRPCSVVSPVFSPNGRRIAYGQAANDSSIGDVLAEHVICPTCAWELRRVNVDGSNDTLLALISGPDRMRSIRWSPDGEWVFLKKQSRMPGTGFPGPDDLWVVPAGGGTPVKRNSLAVDALTFDLHWGSGPMLIEQTGEFLALSTCTNFQTAKEETTIVALPFRRLALSDTLSGDIRARFYRTGTEFLAPRWSPDGTQVAYSSNENSANDTLDLFIGQVSFNHAPTMLMPTADRVVHTGRPYELYANASDSDGEALSYKSPSAFLPAGASFTEATRRFHWPSPGPVCSEHYVVFRVLDGSGGVSSKVIKYTAAIDSVNDLTSDVVTGTELWMTWTAPGDNGVLGRGVEYELRYAQVPLNDLTFGLGTLVTGMPAPAVPGANENRVISDLSPGTTYYVAIRTRDLKNNWSVLSNVVQVTTTSGPQGGYRAQEVRAPITGLRAAQTAVSRPGGTEGTISVVAVEMGLDRGGPAWSIRELRTNEVSSLGLGDSTEVLLQTRDASGAWSDRARLRPGGATPPFAVRALVRPGRIVFVGPYGVRQAWNTVELDGRGGAARLVSAQHSRLGDVKGGFDARGTASIDVAAAESLSMVYEVVAEDSESAQDWYLLVGPPGSEVSTPLKAGSAGARERVPLPTAFRLKQNQPNPFSGRTAIHFDLPVATGVRLEVFDAQGRLVRTLANGDYPAGFHAAEWDHRSDGGQALGAGVYLYRIQAGSFTDQRKMVLLGR